MGKVICCVGLGVLGLFGAFVKRAIVDYYRAAIR